MAASINTEMFETKKLWCLEMIDIIKSRKSRPNLDRIGHMLKRSYGLTSDETAECLESLIEEGRVNRVSFKDEISYRRSGSDPCKPCSESGQQTTSSRIISAIRSMSVEYKDGVSFDNLQTWLISKNPQTRLVKNRLEIALKKEIDAQTVEKTSDDLYKLTKFADLINEKKNDTSCTNQDEEIKKEKQIENKMEISEDMTSDKIVQKKSLKSALKTKKVLSSSDINNLDVGKENENTSRGRPLSKRKVWYIYTKGVYISSNTAGIKINFKQLSYNDGVRKILLEFSSKTK